MFILTKEEGSVESGAYASLDNEGTAVVQFFVSKDDAVSYCVQLEALGEELHVTDTGEYDVDKLCTILGYAYSIIEPGEFIVPRVERLQKDAQKRYNDSVYGPLDFDNL